MAPPALTSAETHYDSMMLQRVPDLWFSDGNLILRCQSSLFRVYKGILSVRSSFFRDMLSIPQPDNQECIEGCPVVNTYDSSDDMTAFLRAIFDSSFFEGPPIKTQFGTLAGVLRLSTKYDVPWLRQRAISHLLTAFPMSLEAHDSRASSRTFPANQYMAFGALELARENNILCILPSALACCCTYSVEHILDGVKMDGKHLEMRSDDKRRILIARQKLLSAKRTQIFGFLWASNIHGCSRRDQCNTRRLQWSYATIDEACDPFWNSFDWERFREEFCPGCFTHSKTSYQEARKALWAELPRLFNLPGWPELRSSLKVDLE